MLHVLHVDVAKVDLYVELLHLLQVFYLDCNYLSGCYVFNEKFECSMQHKTYVAACFFLIQLKTFFNIFFMSQTLIFDIANISNKCFNSMF